VYKVHYGVIVDEIKPAKYHELTYQERKQLRDEYVIHQNYKCLYCGEDLRGAPRKEVADKKINWKLFPNGLLSYPVHLQHNHETGLTEGAVHAYCNAVMWQYEGK
jgi:5-methylcytosine-specific restriction endonuclease McrA